MARETLAGRSALGQHRPAMRPTFADPKTDFVFKRIFGTEEHKDVLLAFLNDVLEPDATHRIASVELLSPEQRPKVDEMKLSIVDVFCTDMRGTRYVVEMQVLNVEAFEKRVVYNVAKTYTNQLEKGRRYPELNDVIGVTVCDFELWPRAAGSTVPMLSRWSMTERHTGTRGLPEIQFVFLELPKLDRSRDPQTILEKWAYFFREAENLDVVPDVLGEPQFVKALDAARTAAFTVEEWDLYIRAGMAIQDEVGALAIVERAGRRLAVEDLCEVLGIELTPERQARMTEMSSEALDELRAAIKAGREWPDSSETSS